MSDWLKYSTHVIILYMYMYTSLLEKQLAKILGYIKHPTCTAHVQNSAYFVNIILNLAGCQAAWLLKKIGK